jgi:tetratricopeptide (TPR) repeat protein
VQQPHALTANPEEQAAYAALEANEIDRAEQGFQALLDKEPANSRALAGIGFVHMKQGNFDRAVTDFEAARQNGLKDPKIETALDTARFWRTMGEATKALEQDQIELAAQRFREALAQRATSPEALAGLAGALLRAHQTSEAALVYARWTKVQPSSAPAWRGLFMAEAHGGQPQQALAVTKRFPSAVQATLLADPEYLMNLAAAYRATGDDAKASQTLERALNLPFPDDGKNMTAGLRLQYAAVLAATGHHEQAAGLYRQVVVEQPDNSSAWQGLILAQHLLHDDAGVVKTLEQMPRPAYDAASRDPGFLSLIAAAYQQQGRLQEAQRLLEEAEAVLAQQGSKTPVDLDLQMAAIELQRNHPERAATLSSR